MKFFITTLLLILIVNPSKTKGQDLWGDLPNFNGNRSLGVGNRGVSDHKISEQIDHLNRWQKLFIFTGKE
jgi:hypothetical protein